MAMLLCHMLKHDYCITALSKADDHFNHYFNVLINATIRTHKFFRYLIL